VINTLAKHTAGTMTNGGKTRHDDFTLAYALIFYD